MDASFTITTIIEIAVAVDKQYAATITRTAVATSYVASVAAGSSAASAEGSFAAGTTGIQSCKAAAIIHRSS